MAGTILKFGLQTEISSLKPHIDKKRTLPSIKLFRYAKEQFYDNLTVHSITQIGDFCF